MPQRVAERARAERQLAELRSGFVRSRAKLERIAHGTRPIVAGPFISEVGFESLYWVPMLRWFVERYGIPARRVTAFSRGGAASWYGGVADSYVELFEHVTPAELKVLQSRRVASTRNEKQLQVSDAESELVQRAGLTGDFDLLHPSLMYQLFWAVWASRRPVARVLAHTQFDHFGTSQSPEAKALLAQLPSDYVAVKPYFSSCFPDTRDNREFLGRMLDRLTEQVPAVVVLATDIDLDEHADFSPASDRVVSIADLVEPANNLDVQSALVRGSRALVTTYGGFAHLGPFLGVPTFAFYSDEVFNQIHLDVMSRAVRSLRESSRAGFVLSHVNEARLLEWLGSTRAGHDVPVADG